MPVFLYNLDKQKSVKMDQLQSTKDLILQWADSETKVDGNNANECFSDGDHDGDDDNTNAENVSTMKCKRDFNIR